MKRITGITTLVFDLDGTLIDSVETIVAQFLMIGKEFGMPVHRGKIMHAIHDSGGSVHRIMQLLFGDLDETSMSAAYDRRAELIASGENIHLSKPFLGVIETLDKLKGRGYNLAIFTSREKFILDSDSAFQLFAEHFDVVIALEDVSQPKPHPEGILAALKVLNTAPEQAAMIGDTVADVQSAQGAGVTSIAVSHGFGRHGDLTKAKADHVIADIPSILHLLPLKAAKPTAVVE